MKVSVDGLRRNLGRVFNEAVDAFKNDDRATMKDALWGLRQMIGGMMCVYSDDPDDLFSNMTDEAQKLSSPSEEDHP